MMRSDTELMTKQAFSLMQVRFDELVASAVLGTDVEVR
jgi:hypothetical protein